jgi:hypothetical protein
LPVGALSPPSHKKKNIFVVLGVFGFWSPPPPPPPSPPSPVLSCLTCLILVLARPQARTVVARRPRKCAKSAKRTPRGTTQSDTFIELRPSPRLICSSISASVMGAHYAAKHANVKFDPGTLSCLTQHNPASCRSLLVRLACLQLSTPKLICPSLILFRTCCFSLKPFFAQVVLRE